MQEQEQDIKHNILEAVVRKCSVKKVFLRFSQNAQENTCDRDSFNKVVPSDDCL